MGFAEYEDYDGLGLAQLVRSGQVTATDVVEASIERIEERNPVIIAVSERCMTRPGPNQPPP
ncbi:MAG TPA: hypothetical protein VM470_03705 [Acidimicrobiia bacterium]|nr:hypothetical protein [Acidimicrobiia bacterium]